MKLNSTLSEYIKRIAILFRCYTLARNINRQIFSREDMVNHLNDVNLFKSILPKECLCFDIGANIGRKSEAMLLAETSVVAFEPHPDVWLELCARCSNNKNWTLVRAAIGDTPSICTLFARESSGQSGLKSEWEGVTKKTYEVPVLTLDLAIIRFGLPFYCKIDVEGWEYNVIKGLSSKIPLLSFEYHIAEDNLNKTRDCIQLISELGDYEINFTTGERSAFILNDWVSCDCFVKEYPTILLDYKHSFGDIFMKLKNHHPQYHI